MNKSESVCYKKSFTRNTIYRGNNQVSFFDGLYKLKFGVVYRYHKTLDFNLFLVIFIPRFGKNTLFNDNEIWYNFRVLKVIE